MKRLYDLSHTIEHGMITYKGPAGPCDLRLPLEGDFEVIL